MNRLTRRAARGASLGLLALVLATGAGAPAFAAGNPSGTGQPSQECGEEGATSTPGRSTAAPGSPFADNGVSGQHYAGEQPQNSKNAHSVSQYDVACFQVTQQH